MKEQMFLGPAAGEGKDALGGDQAILRCHHDRFRSQRRAVPAERTGLSTMREGGIVHEVFRWLERRAHVADAQLTSTKHTARRICQRRAAAFNIQSLARKLARGHRNAVDGLERAGKILP